jgi:hypothetical protein
MRSNLNELVQIPPVNVFIRFAYGSTPPAPQWLFEQPPHQATAALGANARELLLWRQPIQSRLSIRCWSAPW